MPPGVTFYPDFFRRDKRAVLDAKYKHDGVSQEDAMQVFGYMFLLDALHGGLIKPDGNPEEHPQQITRRVTEAKKANWHNFVLLPPKSASSAGDFDDKMRKEEKRFKAHVERVLG